jgi:hypothetical protein
VVAAILLVDHGHLQTIVPEDLLKFPDSSENLRDTHYHRGSEKGKLEPIIPHSIQLFFVVGSCFKRVLEKAHEASFREFLVPATCITTHLDHFVAVDDFDLFGKIPIKSLRAHIKYNK